MNLETEGLNGNQVTIEVYKKIQRGGGASDDDLFYTYTNSKIIDGELNVSFNGIYAWMSAKPKDVEEIYIKVKTADGKYVADNNKDTIHARYLRIKNKISKIKVEQSIYNSPVKIGDTDKTGERIC